MATDETDTTADEPRTTTDHDAVPTRLAGEEAMAALAASGGFIVLRYDTADTHIEYRYNPTTDAYEQLAVTTDDTGEPAGFDSYHKLTDDSAAALLDHPEGMELQTPQPVAFTDSHFPTINQRPTDLAGDFASRREDQPADE